MSMRQPAGPMPRGGSLSGSRSPDRGEKFRPPGSPGVGRRRTEGSSPIYIQGPPPGRAPPSPRTRTGRTQGPASPRRNGSGRPLSPGRSMHAPPSPRRGRAGPPARESGSSGRNDRSPRAGSSGRPYSSSPDRTLVRSGAPQSPGRTRGPQSPTTPGRSQRNNASSFTPRRGGSKDLGSLGQHNRLNDTSGYAFAHPVNGQGSRSGDYIDYGQDHGGSDSQDSEDEWLRCWNCDGPVRMHWEECPSLGCGGSLSLSRSLARSRARAFSVAFPLSLSLSVAFSLTHSLSRLLSLAFSLFALSRCPLSLSLCPLSIPLPFIPPLSLPLSGPPGYLNAAAFAHALTFHAARYANKHPHRSGLV